MNLKEQLNPKEMNMAMLESMMRGLMECSPFGYRSILYSMGFRAGQTLHTLTSREADATLTSHLKTAASKLKAMGIGQLEIEKISLQEGRIELSLTGNMECMVGRSLQGYAGASLTIGLIEGFLSETLKTPVHATETSCIAKGSDKCRFTIQIINKTPIHNGTPGFPENQPNP